MEHFPIIIMRKTPCKDRHLATKFPSSDPVVKPCLTQSLPGLSYFVTVKKTNCFDFHSCLSMKS